MNKTIARICITIFLLTAITFLSGCGEFVHPLSSPEHAYRDKRLEGLWVSTRKSDKGGFYIAYQGHRSYSLLSFSPGAGGIESNSATFFVTRTATHYYINVTWRDSSNPEYRKWLPAKLYIIERYEFLENGDLVLSFTDHNILEKAIREGRLHGDLSSIPATIEDSSKRLLDFIESPGQDVFVRDEPFRKVGN